jgi:hypothetical protein
MRWSPSLIPFLLAGGIGCSSTSKPNSHVTPSGGSSGGNGNHGGGGGGNSVDGGGGSGGSGGGGIMGGGIDMSGGMMGGVVDMSRGGSVDMAPWPGPWPTADLTLYNAAQGLDEALVDANPDDAQNIYAAASDALYVLRPGSTRFVKFTAADGLHIQPFTDAWGHPAVTYITAIGAGHANQVYVGYYGYESAGDPFLDPESLKALGNGDDVSFGSDGKIANIFRFAFRCDAERWKSGGGCWEDRSVRRMFYVHTGVAAGHSFWGFNHGVTHVLGDDFGDHVHPEVWYGNPAEEKLGEFYGLAVSPTGEMLCAGRYAVGYRPWNPLPHGPDPSNDAWVSDPWIFAFTTNTADHSLGDPSTGQFVTRGYREDNMGATITPDGTVWMARLATGLASFNFKASGNFNTIKTWPQVPQQLLDIQADPDGSLWIVTQGRQLLRFTPATGTLVTWPGVNGVTRIYMDTTVTPRALYVSMTGGLGVIRAK